MKTIEFSFDRSGLNYYGSGHLLKVKELYEKVLEDYFLKVFDKKEKITINFTNLNNDARPNYFDDGRTNNNFSIVMNHTLNLQISCYLANNFVFQFYIYNQNNCCGAMTVSDTKIGDSYQQHQLATILQWLKEDIAINQHVSILTCTDVYWGNYNHNSDPKIEDLKPYLRNTKVLLKNNWKVTKLFYNVKSYNVVGLFTKEIPSIEDKIKIINMKIVKLESKLIKIEYPTIGCDPELFFKSRETGDFVPSFYVMGGDKWKPVPVTQEGHAISCDNVMAEYMVPPSKTAKEFVDHNLLVQNYLKDTIAEPNKLDLVIFPYAEFKENDLLDERALLFGCDPDFSVYTNGKPNKVGKPSKTARCCGGHIHIGYNNANMMTNNYIVRALDLFLSVPLVHMEPNNKRKEMYGKAGAYRVTSYGVEYRSPSNFIFSSPELMEWAFNQVQRAINFLNEGGSKLLNEYGPTIQTCIDSKLKDYADTLISKFNLEIIKVKIKTKA